MIKVTSNKRIRTFTIRTFLNGKPFYKYRTIPFDKATFAEMQNNTERDWDDFLYRCSSDYYRVR